MPYCIKTTWLTWKAPPQKKKKKKEKVSMLLQNMTKQLIILQDINWTYLRLS